VVCNIEPAFISSSLLHALLKMIYTVWTNILFSENYENLVCRRSEIYRKIGHMRQLGFWKTALGSKGGESTALGVMDVVSCKLNR